MSQYGTYSNPRRLLRSPLPPNTGVQAHTSEGVRFIITNGTLNKSQREISKAPGSSVAARAIITAHHTIRVALTWMEYTHLHYPPHPKSRRTITCLIQMVGGFIFIWQLVISSLPADTTPEIHLGAFALQILLER